MPLSKPGELICKIWKLNVLLLICREHLKIQFNQKYLWDNDSGLNTTGEDIQSLGNKQTKMKILKLCLKGGKKPAAM